MSKSVVFSALVMVFVIEFARTLPLPESWKARKPLSCDVCMAGWTVLALGAHAWLQGDFTALLIPAAGLTVLCLAVLRWLRASANIVSPPM